MMSLLISLILAHIVGDFVLQSDAWVKEKETKKIKSRFLVWHVLLHVGLMILFTGFQFQYWLGFLGIGISHYIIDLLKIYWDKKKRITAFFLDQALHIGVIIFTVWLYYPSLFLPIQTLNPSKIQLLLACLLSATFVTAIVMKILLQKWSLRLIKTDKSAADSITNKAGLYIGILERLFVFYFTVIGFWGGIGFLFTAKSIFRFNDLSRENDRNYTEYIIIGTLLSFASAGFFGLVYTYFLQKI